MILLDDKTSYRDIIHTHDPETLRNELCQLIDSYKPKVEYLSAAGAPLTSIATSTTILTFVSVQLFLRNGSPPIFKLLAGLNIILLLFMAFISLIIQIMIANAKLRFARIAHDRLEYEDFTNTASP